MGDCAKCFSYYMLLILNIILLLSGLLVLLLGIYLENQTKNFNTTIEVFLIYGGIVILISIFGVFVKNRSSLAKFYYFSLIGVFITGLAVCIFGLVNKDQLINLALD